MSEENYVHTPFGMYEAVAPEPGDVVGLVSGSCPMTVEDYCEDCGTVSVVWFEGNDEDGWVGPMRDQFSADMLVVLDFECAGSC